MHDVLVGPLAFIRMGITRTSRKRFGAAASIAMALVVSLLITTTVSAEAVAEGVISQPFSGSPTHNNALTVGGQDLEAFGLGFDEQLPAVGTVYTVNDEDAELSATSEALVALVLGARNYRFDDGTLLSIAATNGELDTIVQLTIWVYSDNYDLAVATPDQRAAVAELQVLVNASFDQTATDPITAAGVVFAAAPDPGLVRLVVLPPSGPLPTDPTPTTAGSEPPVSLIPAVTTIQTDTRVPADTTQPDSTQAPTTTALSTTASTTVAPSTVAPTTSTTAAPTTMAPTTVAPSSSTSSSDTEAALLAVDTEPQPTVLAAVQENKALEPNDSDSNVMLWLGLSALTAGIGVAFLAARRAIGAKN